MTLKQAISFLRPEVFRRLESMTGLPSPKGAALALLRLAQKDDVTVAEMARVIQTDPALVGRLIKVANSAQMGAHRPVAAVPDALVVLGMRTVRYLALGFSLISEHRHGRCTAFDYARYWSHSLAFGVAARVFANETRCAPAEEMFSLGLLARIGELALATVHPDRYADVLRAAKESGKLLVELESEAFALNHRELSAAMLSEWGLPELFVASVFYHERPEEAGAEPGTRLFGTLWTLALARHIADVCVAAASDRAQSMAPLRLAAAQFSLTGQALEALCDQVVREWQAWAALLSVDSQQVPPFAELSESSKPRAADEPVLPEQVAEPPFRALMLTAEDRWADTLGAWLREAGFVLQRASSGEQALALALDGQVELLILDAALPATDCCGFLPSLRQTRIGRGLYILLLADALEEASLVRFYESGVDEALPKEISSRVFQARLRAAKRLILLQREVERDREEIRRFAAELAVANRRLQQAAMTDVLTGLPNRRYALQRFEQEWRAASRTGAALSCMLIDLDYFKTINDTWGHEVGDLVLRDIAQTMRKNLRARDILCRYAGDEFLVISPETSLSEAVRCAERIRRAIADLSWEREGKVITCSISVGIASRSQATPDVDSLIREADRGAYEAKARGRNGIAWQA